MSKMEKLVLNKLLEISGRPTKMELDLAVRGQIAKTNEAIGDTMRLQKEHGTIVEALNLEIDRMRSEISRQRSELDNFRKGEKAISELYLAADDMLRCKGTAAVATAAKRLREAITASEPFVDIIPF